MKYFYPITIFTSSNPQLIIIEFYEDISNYTDFIEYIEENSNNM